MTDKSFVVANYPPAREPNDFNEVAKESREDLSRENLLQLIAQFEKRARLKPELLDDIWIKGEEGSNGIDKEQFFQLCSMIGEPITNKELDELLREADFDGDGNIDAEEFRCIVNYFM